MIEAVVLAHLGDQVQVALPARGHPGAEHAAAVRRAPDG
jgi:hypothetical protein